MIFFWHFSNSKNSLVLISSYKYVAHLGKVVFLRCRLKVAKKCLFKRPNGRVLQLTFNRCILIKETQTLILSSFQEHKRGKVSELTKL